MSTSDGVLAGLRHWPPGRVVKNLPGGHRNTVVLVEMAGRIYVAKSTRRSEAALRWVADAMQEARAADFVTPEFVPSLRDNLAEDGVTVETFVEGSPATVKDLLGAQPRLERFHQLTRNWPQRPGFASSVHLLTAEKGGDVDLSQMPPDLVETCRAAWTLFVGEPVSVVHGDLNTANVLKTPDGRLALLDWDEARLDASLFDTTIPQADGQQSHALTKALVAWEVAVCWHVEPGHARRQAKRLLTL